MSCVHQFFFLLFVSSCSATVYLHDFRYISRDCLCRHSTKLLWLGDKRWGCATVCVQIGKVLLVTDQLLLDFQVDFYSSFYCTFSDHLFGKREVSTGHHNIECTDASALGWRSEPCPRRVCGYIILTDKFSLRRSTPFRPTRRKGRLKVRQRSMSPKDLVVQAFKL